MDECPRQIKRSAVWRCPHYPLRAVVYCDTKHDQFFKRVYGKLSNDHNQIPVTGESDQWRDVKQARAEAMPSEHDRASALGEVSHGYG